MEKDNAFYDAKFKEMQGYMPFLDEIITRIENTSNDDNQSVRGIQLSKIKSLKSLLCVTDKRMKIENLLRCEQILKKLKDKVGRFPKSDMLNENTHLSVEIQDKEPKVTNIPNFYKEYNQESENSNKQIITIDSEKPKIFEKSENSEKIQNLDMPGNLDISEKLKKSVECEKLEPMEKSEAVTVPSDFQLSRMKLQEITKKVESDVKEVIPTPSPISAPVSTPIIKSYEKEIELVTKVYISDKSQINKLSKMITESISDVGKKNTSIENITDNIEPKSERRTVHSKIVFPPNKSNRSSPQLKSEVIRMSPSSSGFDDGSKKKRTHHKSRIRPRHKNFDRGDSTFRYDTKYNHHKSSKSSTTSHYREKLEQASIIEEIRDTVKNKKKQNNSTINQLLLDEMNDRASISFLKKMRKKLKKEIELEKEILTMVESKKKLSKEESKIDVTNKEQVNENKETATKSDDVTEDSENLVVTVCEVDKNNIDALITTELVTEVEKPDNSSVIGSTIINSNIINNSKGDETIALNIQVSNINLKENVSKTENLSKPLVSCSKLSTQINEAPPIESKIIHSKFEQDVLNALKCEINENNEQNNIFEKSLSKLNDSNILSKKIERDNENLNIQKLRRISLEKYKEKLNTPQNLLSPEIGSKVEDALIFSDESKSFNHVPIVMTDYFKPDPDECKRLDSNSTLENKSNDNDINLNTEPPVQSFDSSTPMSPDIEDGCNIEPLQSEKSFHAVTDISISCSSEDTNIITPSWSTPTHRTPEISMKQSHIYPRSIMINEDDSKNLKKNEPVLNNPNIPFRGLQDDINLKCPNVKVLTQPATNFLQNKQSQIPRLGDQPLTLEDLKKFNYPPFNDRFNVNYPVSANYKGKHPKPNYAFGRRPNINISNMPPYESLNKSNDNNLIERSINNINNKLSKDPSTLNTNFSNSTYGQMNRSNNERFTSLDQNKSNIVCHNEKNLYANNSPNQNLTYIHLNANSQILNPNDDKFDLEHLFKKDSNVKPIDKLSSFYTDIGSRTQRPTNTSLSSTFKNTSPVINSESLKELSLHKNSKFKKILVPSSSSPQQCDEPKPLLPNSDMSKTNDAYLPRKYNQDPRLKYKCDSRNQSDDSSFDDGKFLNNSSHRFSTTQSKDCPNDPRVKRHEINDMPNNDRGKYKKSLEKMMVKKLAKEDNNKYRDRPSSDKKHTKEITVIPENELKLKSSSYKIPKLKRDVSESIEKSNETDQTKDQNSSKNKKEINEISLKSVKSTDSIKEKSYNKDTHKNSNQSTDLRNSSNTKKVVILDETDKFVVYDEMDACTIPAHIRINKNEDNTDSSGKCVIQSRWSDKDINKKDTDNKLSVDINISSGLDEVNKDGKVDTQKTIEKSNKSEVCTENKLDMDNKNKDNDDNKNVNLAESNSNFDKFVTDIKNARINKELDKLPASKHSKPIAEVLPVCQPVEVVPESKDVVTSILDVLKDKTKMSELLKSGKNLPPKLKRKLELLAEIESDEDYENDDDTKDSTISSCSTPVNKCSTPDVDVKVTDETPIVDKPSDVKKPLDVEKPTTVPLVVEKSPVTKKSPTTEKLPLVVVESKSKNIDKVETKDDSIEVPKTTRARGKARLKEVDLLREALPEVFINQGGLVTTGIRMCRLKEFNTDVTVDTPKKKRITRQSELKKNSSEKVSESDIPTNDKSPNKNQTLSEKEKHLLVVVEKCNASSQNDKDSSTSDDDVSQDSSSVENLDPPVKPCPKSKKKLILEKSNKVIEEKTILKNKPGPKPKKLQKSNDSDKNIITNNDKTPKKNEKESVDLDKSSNSGSIYDFTDDKLTEDDEPIVSKSKTKIKIPIKRRKRSKWKSGTITKKIKNINKKPIPIKLKLEDNTSIKLSTMVKSYHFLSGNRKYKCKYCADYNDEDIVKHYMMVHPNKEILISRLSPHEAKLAIEESFLQDLPETLPIGDLLVTNYNDYQCRFCNKQYKNATLLMFYMHIVTTHTGEFVRDRVIDMDRLDKTNMEKNILKGFICEKCNYTQVFKENLNKHILSTHQSEECKIFEINFSKLYVQKPMKNKDIEKKVSTQIKTDVPVNIPPSSENITKLLARNDSPLLKRLYDIEVSTPDEEGVFSTSKNASTLSSELDTLNIPTVNSINDLDIKEEILCTSEELGDEMENIAMKYEALPEDLFENEDVSHNDNVISHDDVVSKNSFNINMERNENFVEFAESPNLVIADLQNEYSITVGNIVVKTTSKDSIKYTCNSKSCKFSSIYFLSFAVHLETTHINDTWDGSCSECGSIATKTSETFTYSQGFTHIINSHIKHNENGTVEIINEKPKTMKKSSSRIQLRPISDLLAPENGPCAIISTEPYLEKDSEKDNTFIQPRIESVMSLNPDSVNISISNEDNEQLCSMYTEENYIELNVDSLQVEMTNKMLTDHDTSVSLNTNANTIDDQQFIDIINNHGYDCYQNGNSKDAGIERPPFFICGGKECELSTNNALEFLYHIKEHSNCSNNKSLKTVDRAWQTCIYCKTVVEKDLYLLLHIINDHGHCKYKCSECPFISASFILTFSHSKVMHSSIEDTLRVQEIPPYREESKQKTVTMNSKSDCFLPYICTIGVLVKNVNEYYVPCKESFYTPSTFLNHIAIKHKNENIHCHICDVPPMAPAEFIMHLRHCHHYHLYKCPYCTSGADTQTLMLNHLMQNHSSCKPIFYHYYIPEDQTNSEHKIFAINFDDNLDYHLKKIFGFAYDKRVDLNASNPQCDNRASLLITNKDEEQNATDCLKSKNDSQIISDGIEHIISNLPQADTVLNADKSLDVIVVDSDDEVTCVNDAMEKTNNITTIEQLFEQTYSDGEDDNSQDPDNPPDTSVEGNKQVFQIGEPRKIRTAIRGLTGSDLLKCGNGDCNFSCDLFVIFVKHKYECNKKYDLQKSLCYHCKKTFKSVKSLTQHLFTHSVRRYKCGSCNYGTTHRSKATQHNRIIHKIFRSVAVPLDPKKTNHYSDYFIVTNPQYNKKIDIPTVVEDKIEKKSDNVVKTTESGKQTKFGPKDIANLPLFPILPENIFCSVCSFSTKVTSNMLRHLQLHSNDVAVPTVAPVNPVPHLQSNEMHFDKMTNLALSSNIDRPRKSTMTKQNTIFNDIPIYIPKKNRYVCGAKNCLYISLNELMLKQHWEILHNEDNTFHCGHCKNDIENSNNSSVWFVAEHLQMHGKYLYRCEKCNFMHFSVQVMKKHGNDKHGIESFIILRGDSPQEEDGAKWLWECTLCSTKVATKKEITDHCYNLHGTIHPYKCNLCQYSSFGEAKMKFHFETEHTKSHLNFTVMYYNKFISDQPATSNSPLWWKQRKRPSHFISDNKTAEHSATEQHPTKKSKIADKTGKKSNVAKTNKPISTEEIAIVIDDKEQKPVRSYKSAPGKQSNKSISSSNAFGEPKNNLYSCPFCNKFTCDLEETMRIHLYEELNYRKWWCGICGYKTFDSERITVHIKEEHHTSAESREQHPDDNKELWIENCLQSQSAHISKTQCSKESSLKKIDILQSSISDIDGIKLSDVSNIDEEPSLLQRIDPVVINETIIDSSEDENKLVICDSAKKSGANSSQKEETESDDLKRCVYCNYVSKNTRGMTLHKRVHWKIKPFSCNYCDVQFLFLIHVKHHHNTYHENEPFVVVKNKLPGIPEYEIGDCEPSEMDQLSCPSDVVPFSFICLQCKVTLTSEEREDHKKMCHPTMTGMIVNKQNVMYRCSMCKRKRKWADEDSLKRHFSQKHRGEKYSYFLHVTSKKVIPSPMTHAKLTGILKNVFSCTYCKMDFSSFSGQLKHHRAKHESLLIRLLPVTKEKIVSTGELKKTFKLRDNYYECIVSSCNIKFINYDRFYSHVRNHYCVMKCNDSFIEHNRNGLHRNSLENEEELSDRLNQIDQLLSSFLISEPPNNMEIVKTSEVKNKPTNTDYDNLVLSIDMDL